jgi:hypothetical protein
VHHEAGQDRSDDGKRAERPGGAPADVRRLDERVHEEEERGRHADRPGDVEAARAARGPAARRDEADGAEQGDQRDRHRQEEHPAPADLGQEAAEDQSEREAGRSGCRIESVLRAAPVS